MPKELKAIKIWLKKDGNSQAKLAAALGYTSSAAVSMWLKRKSIPEYMKTRIMEEIKK